MKNTLAKTHTPDAPGRGADGKQLAAHLTQAELSLELARFSPGIPIEEENGNALDDAVLGPKLLSGRGRRRGSRRLTSQVSFKISNKVAKRLEALGSAKGMSIHAVARELLEQALQGNGGSSNPIDELLKHFRELRSSLVQSSQGVPPDAADFREALDEIRTNAAATLILGSELRRDIATAVRLLLVQFGESPEAATDWVRQNLKMDE